MVFLLVGMTELTHTKSATHTGGSKLHMQNGSFENIVSDKIILFLLKKHGEMKEMRIQKGCEGVKIIKLRKFKLFKGFFPPYIKASEVIRSVITPGRDLCLYWQLEGQSNITKI